MRWRGRFLSQFTSEAQLKILEQLAEEPGGRGRARRAGSQGGRANSTLRLDGLLRSPELGVNCKPNCDRLTDGATS